MRRVNRPGGSPYSREEVQDYVLESYGGVEPAARNMLRRVFIWEDVHDGEIWIGNASAFAEHCAEKFEFQFMPYDYVTINNLLIEAGERLRDFKERNMDNTHTGQKPVQPDKRRVQNTVPAKKKKK